jgi:hypothetical protein
MSRLGDRVRAALLNRAGFALDDLREALGEAPDANAWTVTANPAQWTRPGRGYLLVGAGRIVELHAVDASHAVVHVYTPADGTSTVAGSPLDGYTRAGGEPRDDLVTAADAAIWAALATYLTATLK